VKSKLFYTQILGLLTLLTIFLITIPIYVNRIPKELTIKLENKFKNNRFNWVNIKLRGRDVTLSGIAPSIDLHKQAIKIVTQTKEVRRVNDKISPIIIKPYSISIKYEEKKMIVKGYMPSQKSRDELFKKIIKNHPKVKIIKDVKIAIGEPKEWKSLIDTLSLILKELELGIINVVDKSVVLSGKSQTTQQKKQILNYFKDLDFNIQTHIIAMDSAEKMCKKKFHTLIPINQVVFEEGKWLVKLKNISIFKNLVDIASLCPNTKIEIIGHTDNKGSYRKNIILSEQRAKAIVAKLFQLGIPIEQMKAIGRGEAEPIATNKTEEGRAKNRRIEFKLKGY